MGASAAGAVIEASGGGAFVVGARTVRTLWNDVGSANRHDSAILLHPCVDGLAVIVQAFTARRHTNRFPENSVSSSEIGLIRHAVKGLNHGSHRTSGHR